MDYTTYTMECEPGYDEHTNNEPSQKHADAAFLELARDLEEYIVDILTQPAFERFQDLPVELRYKIYEEYFLNDRHNLTTRDWPELDWTTIHHERVLNLRTSAPFLPALCFADKALLVEAGEFLLSALSMTFINPLSLMQFFQLAVSCRLPRLVITHNIRRLRFLDANGTAQAATVYLHDQRIRSYSPTSAEIANRAVMTALNSCKGLHELNLHFHTAVTCRFDHMPPVEPPIITVDDIKSHLVGFNIKPLLALEELRTLTIFGYSGRATLCSHAPFDIDTAEYQDDTASRLQPLADIAQKVHDVFQARGQVVQITTRSYWGKDQVEVQTVE
jgi:hypothetical protein